MVPNQVRQEDPALADETVSTAKQAPLAPLLGNVFRRVNPVDTLIAGVISIATFFVHNVSYVLSQPFWLDESWVAVSTRVPLRAVPHVTSVTPLGWTLLLRTVVVGGEQRYRLIPLIFSALTVLAAYLLVRSLPWQTQWWAQLAGSLAAIAVLLAPSSLLRNDLKQYTADAFVTLTVLFLMSRIERSWNRGALIAMAAACFFAFMISAVALFVAVAGFTALVLGCLVQRKLRRAVEASIFGLATGFALGVLYLVLYRPHVQSDLTAYWRLFYLPVDKGLSASLTYLHSRGIQMASYLGMGPMLLAILLVVAGVVTLARSGRPALAFAAPVLLVEMIVLGAAKKYPLFDQRTSHFLTVTFAVYASIGVAGMCAVLAKRPAVAGVTVAALATTLFAVNNRQDLRARTIPNEDVRTATAYVAANRHPDDVILVSGPASEGFSYYWPHGVPIWHPTTWNATRFQTGFPQQPEIVVAVGRDAPGVRAALAKAVTKAAGTPGARIWLVRMHVNADEIRQWKAALLLDGVHVKQVIGCSLLLLTPLPAGTPTSPAEVTATRC
jgi:hypothetical protein